MRPSRATTLAAAALVVAVGGAVNACGQAAPPAETIDVSRLRQTFGEEFDGTRLNPRRWTQGEAADPITSRTMSGNAERQIYLDPGYLSLGIQPVTVADGRLRLTARPLTAVERAVVVANLAPLPPEQRAVLSEVRYASGRVMTRDRFSQTYGYFEVRARFDPGRGLWPALWLLPASGGWPPEIDIMEALGHEPDTVYTTAHSARAERRSVTTRLTPADGGWHRYGVMWGPETIDVYVDGAKTGSIPTPPDAHAPMYFIANLAVGGHWPGYPDAATRFPAALEVDYVRAYAFPGRRGSRRP